MQSLMLLGENIDLTFPYQMLFGLNRTLFLI